MLNQVVLVGRLINLPKIEELESGKSRTTITLAVPRSFKNENGEYETDFIDVVLYGVIAENTAEYCEKNDLIGIKGRLETSNYETEAGEKRKSTKIIAEKLTFLSSAKKEEEE